MRSIQTAFVFPLSSVKPLDGLLSYREHCIQATRTALEKTARRRRCPACACDPDPLGDIGGLAYCRCPSCDSIFLESTALPSEWSALLTEISRYRHSPRAFHSNIARSRNDNIYLPKLEWIQSTLRLQGFHQPRLMEVVTPPSEFTSLLRNSGTFADVKTFNEMELASQGGGDDLVEAAVLLESVDRVDDPAHLLREVSKRVVSGGLILVTGLVCSGFDMTLLGLRNLYLYPPDRTNCFSLRGLEKLLELAGFALLEVSTPGVLDMEIVQAHLSYDPSIPLSTFERRIIGGDSEGRAAFQKFLQEQRLSSFVRIVGKRRT